MRSNDDDIKIFSPGKHENSAQELAEIVSATEKYRKDGSTERSAKLGIKLAELTPEFFCPDDARKLKNNELFQLRSLIIFASQFFLQKYLPHPVLASQAINAMYDRLEETSPGMFANISDGSSFSFYGLSVRKKTDIEENIGKSFAMLCDRDDNPRLIALGKSVFSQTEAVICGYIEDFNI